MEFWGQDGRVRKGARRDVREYLLLCVLRRRILLLRSVAYRQTTGRCNQPWDLLLVGLQLACLTKGVVYVRRDRDVPVVPVVSVMSGWLAGWRCRTTITVDGLVRMSSPRCKFTHSRVSAL